MERTSEQSPSKSSAAAPSMKLDLPALEAARRSVEPGTPADAGAPFRQGLIQLLRK